jgi:O-antigen/teichoic acid export membrane protein
LLLIGNASSTVVLAVGGIIVVRLLGPFSYGLYVLALVVPTLLAYLSDAGMSIAVVKVPAKLRYEGDYETANRMTQLSVLVKLAISTVAFLI